MKDRKIHISKQTKEKQGVMSIRDHHAKIK